MTERLAAELIEFIAAEVALEPGPLEAETDLLLTGMVDSLGVVQIVQWLEDRLGAEIDPADVTLENFQTVALMAAFARRLVAGHEARP